MLITTSRLNRYLYDYNNIDYTNKLPSWNNFGSETSVSNGSVPNSGDYWTYYFDGYILYDTNTTMYFGLSSDDDSFLWIIQGDKKWSTTGHPNATDRSWIVNNIPNATLVCHDQNRHGSTGNYSSYRAGSYTFQAGTLYSILLKVTEHGGGSSLFFGVSTTNLSNQSKRSSTFPSQFARDYSIP